MIVFVALTNCSFESEPVVSYAGAMLMRREVGVRYKYFVQPGEDDEAKDEPGAGEHEEDSLYATPRKGLLTGLVDFVVEPDPQGEFGRQLAELYPVGSKVKVYYNSESPSRGTAMHFALSNFCSSLFACSVSGARPTCAQRPFSAALLSGGSALSDGSRPQQHAHSDSLCLFCHCDNVVDRT